MRAVRQRTRMCSIMPSSISGSVTARLRSGRLAIVCLIAALPLTTGCAYIDRARQGSDLAVGVTEKYKVEGLVQADIERRRIRSARCYSPLLTPATVSAAALDDRLGARWIDELLRDCPQFASFLSELTIRRARGAGVLLPGYMQPMPLSVDQPDGTPLAPPVEEP